MNIVHFTTDKCIRSILREQRIKPKEGEVYVYAFINLNNDDQDLISKFKVAYLDQKNKFILDAKNKANEVEMLYIKEVILHEMETDVRENTELSCIGLTDEERFKMGKYLLIKGNVPISYVEDHCLHYLSSKYVLSSEKKKLPFSKV